MSWEVDRCLGGGWFELVLGVWGVRLGEVVVRGGCGFGGCVLGGVGWVGGSV